MLHAIVAGQISRDIIAECHCFGKNKLNYCMKVIIYEYYSIETIVVVILINYLPFKLLVCTLMFLPLYIHKI